LRFPVSGIVYFWSGLPIVGVHLYRQVIAAFSSVVVAHTVAAVYSDVTTNHGMSFVFSFFFSSNQARCLLFSLFFFWFETNQLLISFVSGFL
jgi:hypothetical protein